MNIEPITEHNIEKLQVTVQICEEHVFPFNKTHFVSPFYKRVIFSSPGQSLSSREALYLTAIVIIELQCTRSSAAVPVHALHCTQSSARDTVHPLQCTRTIRQNACAQEHALQCTSSSVRPTVHALQCTSSSVQPTVHALQCIAITV